MSHYISKLAISSVLTQIKGCIKEFKEITFPGYIQMYTGVHSDVARESYSFDLFDMPLDVPLECKKTRDTWLMYPCGFL